MRHADLPLVIDFHVHMLEREVFKASTNKTVFTGFGATPASAPRPGAQQLMGRMFDPKAEIEDMDARGIDLSVVSASTVLQGTSWADPQTDLALCKRCNDQAADWVARYPKRFVGSCVLPLQDPQLARCKS
jgi:predicted TIM-barrel fold metal-dependent hydrolase